MHKQVNQRMLKGYPWKHHAIHVAAAGGAQKWKFGQGARFRHVQGLFILGIHTSWRFNYIYIYMVYILGLYIHGVYMCVCRYILYIYRVYMMHGWRIKVFMGWNGFI